MGFFQKIFGKKKKKAENADVRPEERLVLKDGIYSTPQERENFLRNCCDLIKIGRAHV